MKTNGQTEQEEVFNVNTDENISGDQHLNEPVTEDSELGKLQDEVAEWKDKYIRLSAEFDNYRKRTSKERIELIQTAGKDVITDLLDVLDDTERAEKQLAQSDDEPLKEGVQLVFNKLKNVLAQKGLKAMEVVNKDFNPDLHEAITEIDAGEDMRGKVVAEIQKGYYISDKIIRFAKVVVGK